MRVFAYNNTSSSVAAVDPTEYYVKIFWGMLGLLTLCIILYGFFFQATMRNVVHRSDAQKEIFEITSRIGILEQKQETLKGTLTAHYAKRLGFENPKEKIYVARKYLARETGPSF